LSRDAVSRGYAEPGLAELEARDAERVRMGLSRTNVRQ
jgi:hypothetical protein